MCGLRKIVSAFTSLTASRVSIHEWPAFEAVLQKTQNCDCLKYISGKCEYYKWLFH